MSLNWIVVSANLDGNCCVWGLSFRLNDVKLSMFVLYVFTDQIV